MINRQVYRKRYQKLGQLLRCFHQDWAVEYPGLTIDQVILKYRAESQEDHHQALIRDIDSLLAERKTEEEYGRVLLDFGCEYGPDLEGWKVTDWLRHIRDLMFGKASSVKT